MGDPARRMDLRSLPGQRQRLASAGYSPYHRTRPKLPRAPTSLRPERNGLCALPHSSIAGVLPFCCTQHGNKPASAATALARSGCGRAMLRAKNVGRSTQLNSWDCMIRRSPMPRSLMLPIWHKDVAVFPSLTGRSAPACRCHLGFCARASLNISCFSAPVSS